MKLKLRRNVLNISLYKILFFIVVVYVLSMLRQIKVSIDLQWEKMKFGSDCYLIADILTNVFQKCLFSGPLL